jgi:hypothetical protein
MNGQEKRYSNYLMMKFKEIQLDFTNLQSFGAFLNVRV